MKKYDILILVGIRRAIKIAHKKGELNIGDLVAHPSDRRIFKLRGVNKGIAQVGMEPFESRNWKGAKKSFPVRELYKPNVAVNEAKRWAAEQVEKAFPAKPAGFFLPGSTVPKIT